jgi:Tfp pilus assembly protein PilX
LNLRNERGYALVLVLVIITITFTMALSMSGMALSARKQFNKTDELNKATDLAEMGVAHYEAWLANAVAEANTYAETKADEVIKNNNGNKKPHPLGKVKSCKKNNTRCTVEYDEHFLLNLKSRIGALNYSLIRTVEGNNLYEVKDITISEIQANDTIIVKFKSYGKTKVETKILESIITIEKNAESLVGENKPLPSNYEVVNLTPIDLKGQDKHLTFETSTYFEKKIEIQGNRILKVNGNAFFKDKVVFSGTADIFVYGDAIFTVPPEFNGNAYSFCVYGNIYRMDEHGKLVEYTDFPQGKNKSCPRPQDDEWYINPDESVEVQY